LPTYYSVCTELLILARTFDEIQMKVSLYILFLILTIASCSYSGEKKTIDASDVTNNDTEEDAVEYTPLVDEEWITRALNYQTGDSLFPLISDFTNIHTQDMVSSPNSGDYNISFKFDTFDLDADSTQEYVLEITYSDSSSSGYKWINNKRIAIIALKNNKYEIIFDNNYSTETSIDDFGLLKESTGAKKPSDKSTPNGDQSFYRIIDDRSEKVLDLLSHSSLMNSYLDHDFNLLDFEYKNDLLHVHYKYAFYMHRSELTGLKSDTGRFVLLESDEIVKFEWNEINAAYVIHSAKTLDEKKLDFFENTLWDPGYHQGSAVFIAFEDELRRQYSEANELQKSGIKHVLDNYDFY